MTPEQYYWFVRRPALMKAAGYGRKTYRFGRYEGQPYLFKYVSDGNYDESKVQAEFYADHAFGGGCSSLRKGGTHGRNYDWYFDRAPSFVVRTPRTAVHRHATLGVATLMSIGYDQVKDGWNELYGVLECAVVDGINDAGLACNVNVVPPGDSPDFRLCDPPPAAGAPRYVAENITFGTRPGRPRRFTGAICRTILDGFGSVDEVAAGIRDFDWYAARDDREDFREEFHAMVSDAEKTAVIEFVANRLVIHTWKADGEYLGCDMPEYSIGRQVRPIMTNFYLSRWSGDVANTSMLRPLAERDMTVTPYGMGYERYGQIDGDYSANGVEETLRNAWYRQLYSHEGKMDLWPSEFLTFEAPSYTYASDPSSPAIREYLDRKVIPRRELEDAADAAGKRLADGKTWQTVSSSTYDLATRTLRLRVQEKDVTYEETL